jgi:UDP-3-O-[3-hydroxymyristoyl] glucosamine N-acyltransferase
VQAGYRLAEIVARLGGEAVGDDTVVVQRVASLQNASPGAIAFLSQSRHRAELDGTRASAVILGREARDATSLPRILSDEPYLYFARVSALLHPDPPVVPGVHPQAAVAPSASVAASARVDACAVIEARAQVGDGAWIGPGCWIGSGAAIGPGTRLHGGVRVYPGCVIGARGVVHAGAVIGADGFGFAPDRGTWFKIPQIGRVLVGDDVEIGANTTIDRGALDDTVIEDGVKLDNLIQIGHNCRIGAHTAIAGCVGIAGSVTVGRHCMIGGAAMINGHLSIADRVVIAGGSGVSKSIAEPGTYIAAIPAVPEREWRRTVALLRNLDRMNDRLRRLERGAGQGGSDD